MPSTVGDANRRFARLPELELPRGFDRKAMKGFIDRITSPKLARLVRSRYVTTIGERRAATER